MEARGRYARICVQVDVNKLLITSILIGDFEQPVSYEGIQRLCFACGRIGHQKESCLYAVRAPIPLQREASECTTDPVGGSCKSYEGNVAADGKASTTDDQELTYGPWLVVTRRRNGNKPAKKEWSTKDAEHNPKSMGSGKAKSVLSYPSNFHTCSLGGPNNSKRKVVLG